VGLRTLVIAMACLPERTICKAMLFSMALAASLDEYHAQLCRELKQYVDMPPGASKAHHERPSPGILQSSGFKTDYYFMGDPSHANMILTVNVLP